MQIIESASSIHNLAYRLSSDHCAVVCYMTVGLQIRGALLCWGGHGGDRRLSGCGSSVTVGRFTFAGLVDTFPLTFSLFLCNAFSFQLCPPGWVLGSFPCHDASPSLRDFWPSISVIGLPADVQQALNHCPRNSLSFVAKTWSAKDCLSHFSD